MIDGQQQRKALGAEQALKALESGDASRARTAAAEAVALDQVAAYDGLVAAVDGAATDIESEGKVSRESWSDIAAMLGDGPLKAWAEERAEERAGPE